MNALVKSVASSVNALSSMLNRVCWLTASAFMLVMLATVALQVITRYVFFSPPSWTEELARYCMIWAGYLGATVAFYRSEDPVLLNPDKIRQGAVSKLSLVLRSVAVLLFMVPVLYWSPVIIGHHMIRETESMELISGYIMLIIPLFSAVILIHMFARLINGFTNYRFSE